MTLRVEDVTSLKPKKALFDFTKEWEFFASAFNEAERVRLVFERVQAAHKLWVVLPEYGFSRAEINHLSGVIQVPGESPENLVAAQIVNEAIARVGRGGRMLFDITGMMRPHILALVSELKSQGICRFDVVYAEPEQYRLKERTAFSGDDVDVVRQVVGFEGIHTDDVDKDVLIIGMGYDDALVSRVANDKDSARLIQLLSLPSLSPDMYQESLLRLDRVGMAEGQSNDDDVIFAPANDPFVVAWELERKLRQITSRAGVTNVYLCPLATKVQALGFALFYVRKEDDIPVSVIFPFARSYARETSIGMGKCWLYEVEV